MVWAGITAFLRDAFQRQRNSREPDAGVRRDRCCWATWSSGRGRTRLGYNFPQTKNFDAVTQIPRLMKGSRVSIGLVHRVGWRGGACCGSSCSARYAGFAQQVGGLAPAAARYAGFSARQARCGSRCSPRAARRASRVRSKWPVPSASSRRTCRPATASRPSSWPSSGGCIRSGSIFSAILMSMFYIGGELAQSRMGLPKSHHRRVPGAAAVLRCWPATRSSPIASACKTVDQGRRPLAARSTHTSLQGQQRQCDRQSLFHAHFRRLGIASDGLLLESLTLNPSHS